MTTPTRTLLRTIEGPKGKAEIFEVMQASTNDTTTGSETIEYEVVHNSESHKVRALGEASIVAEELVAGR